MVDKGGDVMGRMGEQRVQILERQVADLHAELQRRDRRR